MKPESDRRLSSLKIKHGLWVTVLYLRAAGVLRHGHPRGRAPCILERREARDNSGVRGSWGWDSKVLYCTILYGTMLWYTVLWPVQCSIVLYSTMLYCIVLWSLQYSTIQFCTVQYCTVLWSVRYVHLETMRWNTFYVSLSSSHPATQCFEKTCFLVPAILFYYYYYIYYYYYYYIETIFIETNRLLVLAKWWKLSDVRRGPLRQVNRPVDTVLFINEIF
jgi:hypothetical protein